MKIGKEMKMRIKYVCPEIRSYEIDTESVMETTSQQFSKKNNFFEEENDNSVKEDAN